MNATAPRAGGRRRPPSPLRRSAGPARGRCAAAFAQPLLHAFAQPHVGGGGRVPVWCVQPGSQRRDGVEDPVRLGAVAGQTGHRPRTGSRLRRSRRGEGAASRLPPGDAPRHRSLASTSWSTPWLRSQEWTGAGLPAGSWPGPRKMLHWRECRPRTSQRRPSPETPISRNRRSRWRLASILGSM